MPRLAVFVALAEHVIERSNLALAALDFARLFKVALLPDVANYAFAVQLLLQTAQSLFTSTDISIHLLLILFSFCARIYAQYVQKKYKRCIWVKISQAFFLYLV